MSRGTEPRGSGNMSTSPLCCPESLAEEFAAGGWLKKDAPEGGTPARASMQAGTAKN